MTTITLYIAIHIFGNFRPYDTWQVDSASSEALVSALKECRAKGKESDLYYRCVVTRTGE